MNLKFFLLLAFSLVSFFDKTASHGMVVDPVNRASRWRVDGSKPRDYSENEGYCGGFGVQWKDFKGKCGFCGDRFGDPQPRAHELGGTFGQGVIVKSYPLGSTVNITVKVTGNHKGFFYFQLCNLDEGDESDACFERHQIKLADGSDTFELTTYRTGYYYIPISLPSNVACKHCVLQWTYVTANAYGVCPSGKSKMGCGPQEHFRTCSDIRIFKGKKVTKVKALKDGRKHKNQI